MNIFLVFAFLFATGSVLGWGLEFFFRNLISHKGPKGLFFINPGFCRGPWLPIYGVGLSVMFFISYDIKARFPGCSDLAILVGIAVAMTGIEFLGGLILLKFLNMRLWDYRDRKGNIMGLICPLFSLFWGLIGVLYHLVIHPLAIDGLIWLSKNLAFSFVIGLFFGFFIVDMAISAKDAYIIKTFADDHDVIILYDELKQMVQSRLLEKEKKNRFFNQTSTAYYELKDALTEHLPRFDKKIRKKR